MKNMALFLVVLLVIVGFDLTGCISRTAEDTVALEDTMWVLESYGEQGNLQTVLEGTKITATFDRAEGRVHGSAGCNDYGGPYEVNKNGLSIPEIANTEQYCTEPAGIMEQEQRYLNTLQAAESYEIQSGKLQITSGSQVLVFSAE